MDGSYKLLEDAGAGARPSPGGAIAESAAWAEADRLDALRRYDILDTAPEAAFDDIVRVAAQICRAPMAAVSLVDEARQWFKATVGLGIPETPRDVSFCAHAIRRGGLVEITDAILDPEFRDNPLVTGEPGIRFYAGAVLTTSEGYPLGSLCVLDDRPRPDGLNVDQVAVLQALGRQVTTLIEFRRALATERETSERFRGLAELREREQAELLAGERRLHLALEAGLVGAWEWDIVRGVIRGDAQVARTLAMDPQQLREGLADAEYFETIHPEDRGWVAESLRAAIRTSGEFVEEYRVATGQGLRWVLTRGRSFHDPENRPVRCTGVAIDITERKASEEALKEANAGRELAMQAAQLGRWDHNPSEGIYFWDQRCAAMLGLPPGAHPSAEPMLALVHPEDRDRVAEAIRRAVQPDRIGAYAEEYRVLRPESDELRWVAALGRSTFEDGRCTRFVGVLQDITDRKLTEAHQRLLANELNHRVKNTLATVQALVSQTLRTAASPDAARQSITERLIALGRAHDILTRTSWSAAPIDQVVHSAISALGVDANRVHVEGPARRLAPRAALSLAMALHELATNAVKYGALSNDTGRVDISWSVGSDPSGRRLQLSWRERGGPPVTAPTRRGFGSRLIQSALGRELRGSATLEFPSTGVVWSLDAPLDALEAADAED